MLTVFRSYNQHWLIQEAEQRRLAGGSTKPHVASPSIAQQNTMNVNPPPHQQQPQNNGLHSNMMMTSPVSHGGEIPTLTNNIHGNSPVYENSSYVNHQQVITLLPTIFSIFNRYLIHLKTLNFVSLPFIFSVFLAQSSAE